MSESRDRRVRIVYVIDNLSFRGGERTFLQLAAGLDRERYRIAVACSPGGTFVERLRELEVPVVEVEMRNRWRLDSVFTLARALRECRPRIVHTQGRGDPFGRLAARLAGVPIVFSTTAMIAGRYRVRQLRKRLLYRAIDRLTDRWVDRFIVVNTASVDVLVRRHGVPAERVTVIPNGIELDRYAPDRVQRGAWREAAGVESGVRLVGGLGRLTWQKGFDDLVRAFGQMEHPRARLILAGEGGERARLETLVRRLGLGDRCRLPGFVRDVPGFLADLDLFVLSSRIEGHPMALLEAMAMGRPLIATEIPGVSDTIDDGVDGRLVPVGDLDAMAAAIDEMLTERNAARAMGRNARRRIEREYTVERMVARTAGLYEQAVAGLAPGPAEVPVA